MLSLLHPCSRYSTDRCLICGGTFRDHLILRWYMNGCLYSPYDRYVDSITKHGIEKEVLPPIPTTSISRRINIHSTINNKNRFRLLHRFHRQYVKDIPPQKPFGFRFIPSPEASSLWSMERHTTIDGQLVSYRLPVWTAMNAPNTTNSTKKRISSFGILCKALLVTSVERLMELEIRDNNRGLQKPTIDLDV
jgi:hypothetical protein